MREKKFFVCAYMKLFQAVVICYLFFFFLRFGLIVVSLFLLDDSSIKLFLITEVIVRLSMGYISHTVIGKLVARVKVSGAFYWSKAQ